MLYFSESGHPVFCGSNALERGDLKSKGKGQLSIHFCGDEDTAEVVLRRIISVNQFSIYRAVADMCDELACRICGCSERTGELVAQDMIFSFFKINKVQEGTINLTDLFWRSSW